MQKINLRSTGFFLMMILVLPFGSCQNGPEINTIEISGQREIELVWGDLVLPLSLASSPYYYKAKIELPKEKVLALIDEPVQFRVNGKPYFISGIKMSTNAIKKAPSKSRADSVFVASKSKSSEDESQEPKRKASNTLEGNILIDSLVKDKAYVITKESQADLQELLTEGNRISISTIRSRKEGIIVNVDIDIYDPYEKFKPRYYVPPISHVKPEISHWQWAKLPGRKKGIVRFDPQHPGHVKILKAYSDSSRYELVSIPGFESGSHYVGVEDYVVPSSEVTTKDTLKMSPVIDPYKIQDQVVEMSVGWKIRWGAMEISPRGEYVKPETFKSSIKENMFLLKGKQELPIAQVLLTITQLDGPVKQIVISGEEPKHWESVFRNLPGNSSIYFEELVIREQDGKLKRVPLPFLLNVW